jgi:hypothetical protein
MPKPEPKNACSCTSLTDSLIHLHDVSTETVLPISLPLRAREDSRKSVTNMVPKMKGYTQSFRETELHPRILTEVQVVTSEMSNEYRYAMHLNKGTEIRNA